MRVLVVASTFPNAEQPNRGVFVWERVRRLAQRASVEVVAPVPWFPGNRWLRGDRARIPWREQRDGVTVHHPRFLSLPGVGKFLDGVLYGLSLVPFLARLRKRFAFEVLDAHFAFPDGLGAVVLGAFFRRPVVVTLRGSIVRLSTYALHRPQLRWTLARAARLTAVSESLRGVAVRLGVPHERVRVIPNGVDAAIFRPGDRAEARRACGLPATGPVLLTVAGVYAGKGQHLVVRALRGLAARFPGATYVVVGTPRPGESYVRQLQETARELGVEDRLRLVGPQPHAGLAPWYRAADCFVLATESEGWPNVLLESLACGTPVVATDVGGVAEIARDGVDGVLMREREPAAVEAAVAQVLARSWSREALVARAQGFDWAVSVEQALEELNAAMKGAA
jgi:glycosyltransferase involved in cell wall biosynthesis